MALTAIDLIAPNGELQRGLFPSSDITTDIYTLVNGWIAKAYTKIEGVAAGLEDRAAEHYAYYLAYTYLADRLAGEPSSVTVDDVSKSIDFDRVGYFLRRAKQHLDDYEEFFNLPANPEKPQSTWIRNRVIF